MLQETLKAIACDHRAFTLPSYWSQTAVLTGHELVIHEALFKQIGEFSLPLKEGINIAIT